ncbi:MAG: hypothetical protein Q8M02_05020 [Candidatus Didemnitutus sp.]|nr:hypothetical protein [Candidatus Didemnitutus sp.]
MLRGILVFLLFGGLPGCAKPVPLPDVIVRGESRESLAAFRAELGRRFTAEQLEPLDTALNELRLDAMHREVTPAAAREHDMLGVVHGKSVREVQLLGWQARRARLHREIALFTATLEQDLKLKQESTGGVSQTVANRLQNVQDILARLHNDLAETEQRLTRWSETPASR